ncbi:MAG: NAD(P)H-binding protein [Bacteroidales bacterium]|nr:NAD(P)H-binding protein [Bacteroidales bacterium]
MTSKQDKKKKTAVVFGATGLIGKELVKTLLNDDSYERVTVVVRSPLALPDSKLSQIKLTDFSKLSELKGHLKSGNWFCCLGTTIKTAGSREAFANVDLEMPKAIAGLAEAASAESLVVISSIGANASSSNFYLRTKGEMEMAVMAIYKGNLKFVRPSLLMGDRVEFRLAESISAVFMKAFGWMMIGTLRKYRGIKAGDLARAMIIISNGPAEKVTYESDELQKVAKESNMLK